MNGNFNMFVYYFSSNTLNLDFLKHFFPIKPDSILKKEKNQKRSIDKKLKIKKKLKKMYKLIVIQEGY